MVINDKVNLNNYKPGKVKIIVIDTHISHISGFNHANRVIQTQQDIQKGFRNLPFPEVTAWDKALYYFCNINNNYDNIWFLEDDCFFINENIFEKINVKYNNVDLLVKENNRNFEKDRWCWNHVKPFLKEPMAFSFIQTCRLSRNLLRLIKNVAIKYKRLVIIETLFNTLVMHNNLTMKFPQELSLLHWDKQLTRTDTFLREDYFYHPVKDIELHQALRNNHKRGNNQSNNNQSNNNQSNNNQSNNKSYINNHELLKLNVNEKQSLLNRSNTILKESFNFMLYKQLYPDLRNLTDNDLLHHYFNDGINENRICNLSFDYDEYKKCYSDLHNLLPQNLLHHYVYDGIIEQRCGRNKSTFSIPILR